MISNRRKRSTRIHPMAHQDSQRRGTHSHSTACDVMYPMYVLRVSRLIEMYERGEGDEHSPPIMEVHQSLLQKDLLVKRRELPASAKVIFVSHEWLGWDHPDPSGVQLRTLVKVLLRLLKGEIKRVDIDGFHSVVYKHSFQTKCSEWKDILSDAYVWVDWMSMPQAAVEDENENTKKYLKAKQDGGRAIRSIPGYVELSSFMLVLCPEGVHADRMDAYKPEEKAVTCYRTWRSRGWCLLELFACYFSVRKSHPTLLVRSEDGTPQWISNLECLKLVVGHANFTCCDRNHVITTATQKIAHGDDTAGNEKPTEADDAAKDDIMDSSEETKCDTNTVPCDKPVVLSIMQRLMRKCTTRLFERPDTRTLARLHLSMRRLWLRGLLKYHQGDAAELSIFLNGSDTYERDENDGSVLLVSSSSTEHSCIRSLRRRLRWDVNVDGDWFDAGGVSLLMYAILFHDEIAVSNLLASLPTDGPVRHVRLASRLPKEGVLSLGLPGSCTALMVAVSSSTPTIARLLLEHGADPYARCHIGSDCVQYLGIFNRLDMLDFWMERFPKWDFSRANYIVGGLALLSTAFMGANKADLVKRMLIYGADPKGITHHGSSLLHCAAQNEDTDMTLLHFLCGNDSEMRERMWDVNMRTKSTTLKFRVITKIFTFLYKYNISRSGLVSYFANAAGNTALHAAVERGDLRSVELLLGAGADPLVRTGLGMDAFGLCESHGPFPLVRRALDKAVALRREGSTTSIDAHK